MLPNPKFLGQLEPCDIITKFKSVICLAFHHALLHSNGFILNLQGYCQQVSQSMLKNHKQAKGTATCQYEIRMIL